MKVITNFRILIQYAKAMGQARLNGTEEEYKLAKDKHDEYRDACLKADGMYIE